MKTVPFNLFLSSDLYTFATRLAEVVAQILSDNPYVILLVAQIQSGTTDLSKALGKALKSEFTSLLLAKDEVRDARFRGLCNYIKAFLNHKETSKAEAAQKLVDIIDEIGRTLYKLGYIAETAKLNELFERFNSSEATQWLETIKATEWYVDLKESQADFEASYAMKVSTEAALDQPLAKDAKIRIVENSRSLLDFIERNIQFDAAKYTPVRDKINEIITDTVAVVRARETRNEKAAKEAAAATSKA